MNNHLLLHLKMYVQLYGPLWTHSAFPYEDNLGYLVRQAHGTKDIGHQVSSCDYLSHVRDVMVQLLLYRLWQLISSDDACAFDPK